MKNKNNKLTCSKHNRILIGKDRCLDCKPRLHKIGRHGEVSYFKYKKNGEKIPKSFIKKLYEFFIKT